MFNRGLQVILENEEVEIYEKQTIIKPSGSTSIKWIKKENILCNIQANHQYGDVLQQSQAGDVVKAFYNMYTRKPIFEGQRIKRVQDDKLLYEIRNVEHNGKKTILEHYKGYLERVDNQ